MKELSPSAIVWLVDSWDFLTIKRGIWSNNTGEKERVPSNVEQHVHMLVFLGQGLHLFLLRHIHDLGLDPCWWRTKELWFRSTSQIHFNGNGTDLHKKKKKKKDIYLRLHKNPHPTPSALFGLTREMYQINLVLKYPRSWYMIKPTWAYAFFVAKRWSSRWQPHTSRNQPHPECRPALSASLHWCPSLWRELPPSQMPAVEISWVRSKLFHSAQQPRSPRLERECWQWYKCRQ